MRVLGLSSEYPPARIYGLGRFVHGLARAQAAQGDCVQLLTNSTGGAEDDVLLDGVEVHRIAFPNPPRPPDGHGEVLQFNDCVLERFYARRERFRDVDVVVGHDWLTALAAREIARDLGKPLVTTFHDEVVGKRFGVLDEENRFIRDLEALAAHDASHVVANSRFIAREVGRNYGVPPDRISAVPGGIDPLVLAVSAAHRIRDVRAGLAGPDDLLVGYVGRFDAEKGLDVLLEGMTALFERDPRLRLALAGSGRLEAMARRALEPVGARARLLGYLKGETLAYFYRACDILVVPSMYEPFGLVALEAMTAGAATIVTDAGGLPEIVRDGEDGVVVPAGDPGALAHAIERLAGDTALRARLARSARERAQTTFSWAAIARETRAAYEKAVAAPRSVCAVAPAPPPRPLVSVTVATHDAPVHVETALRSLFARTSYRPLEAVVVDDASALPARERLRTVVAELRSQGHEVRLLENEENRLFSAAQDQAIAEAKGEFVCLLNDDTEVPRGSEEWLDGLVWFLESSGAGTVTPVTLQRDGRIYCAGAFGRGGHRLRDVSDGPEIAASPRRTEWNNMACLLTRKVHFARVGPLATSSETAHYGSDRDWCLRFSGALGKPHLVHPARLFHFEKEALRSIDSPFRASPETRIPASIVLVAYDGIRFTRAAIEAVLAHTAPPFELVLVDNGARDGTRAFFHDVRDTLGGRIAVQVIENAENRGYPVAANQGARAARGRHVVFLNNDTEVRSGWLAALLRCVEEGSSVGAVTAKILNNDGTVQNAGGILHHPDGSFTIPHANADPRSREVASRRGIENAGGPCLLVTRPALESAGVFDESFSPGYFEDSDLCMRLRDAGFRLLYEPGAEVMHHGKATASLVAREGKLAIWERFEENKRAFHERWRARLEADEARRRSREEVPATPARRQRILLCYNKSATTTAAYCERTLRREHDVVTAGRGQEIDLGPDASAAALCETAGGVDVLLVIEGENFIPRALEEAPCRTAWWAIDNHIFARDAGAWHPRLACAYDHVFIAQRDHAPSFEARGVEPVWLPLACDPEVHRSPPVERDLDVVFVGNVLPIHRRRRALLDRLRARFRIEERSGVYLEEMARLHARAKIVFNCSLAGDLNMRVFEGLASGALVATDRIANGMGELFRDGEHLACYQDDALEDTIARLLEDRSTRERIGAAGQALVLAEHTYAHRMRRLLETVAREPRRRRQDTRPLEVST